MLPYHHQPLVRQKGQRFRRGDQGIGGGVVHQVFVQFFQSLGQELLAQCRQGGGLDVLLRALQQIGTLHPAILDGLHQFFAIHMILSLTAGFPR